MRFRLRYRHNFSHLLAFCCRFGAGFCLAGQRCGSSSLSTAFWTILSASLTACSRGPHPVWQMMPAAPPDFYLRNGFCILLYVIRQRLAVLLYFCASATCCPACRSLSAAASASAAPAPPFPQSVSLHPALNPFIKGSQKVVQRAGL